MPGFGMHFIPWLPVSAWQHWQHETSWELHLLSDSHSLIVHFLEKYQTFPFLFSIQLSSSLLYLYFMMARDCVFGCLHSSPSYYWSMLWWCSILITLEYSLVLGLRYKYLTKNGKCAINHGNLIRVNFLYLCAGTIEEIVQYNGRIW